MNMRAIHSWLAAVLLAVLLLAACVSPTGTDVSVETAVAPTGETGVTAATAPTPTGRPDTTVKAERVRAWVLMTAENPSRSADAIGAHFTEGGDAWVIIRADVIDAQENLMIAVDAADEESLQVVLGILMEEVGSEPRVLRVVEHNPSVPHAAHSFVTPKELDVLPAPEYETPGRQKPKSPGANPWG